MVADQSHPILAGGFVATLQQSRAAMMRFLLARGATAVEAEDILQDMLLKQLESAPGPVSDPKAYLYRMAHNLFIDRRRSALQRARREERWTEAATGGGMADPAPSIETTLIDREALAAVQAVLAALPERTRDIVRRYRIDGQAQRDIAEAHAISLSAVEKHLQRAYRALLDARRQLDAGSCAPLRLSVEEASHDA